MEVWKDKRQVCGLILKAEHLATTSLASHLFILKFNFPPTWPLFVNFLWEGPALHKESFLHSTDTVFERYGNDCHPASLLI